MNFEVKELDDTNVPVLLSVLRSILGSVMIGAVLASVVLVVVMIVVVTVPGGEITVGRWVMSIDR